MGYRIPGGGKLMGYGIIRSDKPRYRVGKSLFFATGINRIQDI